MNVVFVLKPEDIAAFLDYYEEEIIETKDSHILAMIKGEDYSIHVYQNRKVLIQGPGARNEASFWQETLDLTIDLPEINQPNQTSNAKATYQIIPHYGSDEVGTGDFFGPIVVVCAYVEESISQELIQLGVKDSKKLNDSVIIDLAKTLQTMIPFEKVILPNPKYNELIDSGYNQNKIKAYLHNHAIRKLKQIVKDHQSRIIIDQFTPKESYFQYLSDYTGVVQNITMVEKAESHYLGVACASVLARFFFLEEMKRLNEQMHLELPLGAGPIVDLIGKRIYLEHGEAIFHQIAKFHFKNLERIRAMTKK